MCHTHTTHLVAPSWAAGAWDTLHCGRRSLPRLTQAAQLLHPLLLLLRMLQQEPHWLLLLLTQLLLLLLPACLRPEVLVGWTAAPLPLPLAAASAGQGCVAPVVGLLLLQMHAEHLPLKLVLPQGWLCSTAGEQRTQQRRRHDIACRCRRAWQLLCGSCCTRAWWLGGLGGCWQHALAGCSTARG
jgi:hypothetical protein